MADPQCEQQAFERRRLAGRNRREQIVGPFGRHLALPDGLRCRFLGLVGQALHLEQVVLRQLVQVGHAGDQICFDQAVNVSVAQPFDVHHAPAGEVADRLLALRGAGQATGAARDDLAFFAHDVRAAHRAGRRQGVHRRFRHQAAFEHDAQHLGNDVAGAAHDDRVAHAHVLAPHFVFVVQRGVGDGHAANRYGHQARHRRDGAGAADLDLDRLDRGQGFFGREFMRQREARCARDEAQRALVLQPVDLVDDAVDLVRERRAALADVAVEPQQAIAAGDHLALLRHRQAERIEPVEHGRMRCGQRRWRALELADAIGEKAQPARTGNARV